MIRFFIAFPASLLAILGLWDESRRLQAGGSPFSSNKQRILGILIGLYGISSGFLFRPKFFPIEVYRTGLAMTMAFVVIQISNEMKNYWLSRLLHLKELQVVQRERESISLSLHDQVIQKLFSASLEIDTLDEKSTIPTISKDLKVISGVVREAIDDIRLLIHENRTEPICINDLGLAISETCERLQRLFHRSIDLQFQYSSKGSDKDLIEDSGDLLLIVQEALMNGCKHAPRAEIEISVTRNERELSIVVHDAGPGFDIGKIAPGKGLECMRVRSHRIGAKLQIKSDNGTTVFLRKALLGRFDAE